MSNPSSQAGEMVLPCYAATTAGRCDAAALLPLIVRCGANCYATGLLPLRNQIIYTAFFRFNYLYGAVCIIMFFLPLFLFPSLFFLYIY
jgi:hypothetical protein